MPLRRIADERGAVLLMLKKTDPHFLRFGEIYVSTVHRGVVNAWKNHTRITANHACVQGRIKLVLHDARSDSGSCGTTMEVHLSPEQYGLVVIPPGVWHGFQGVDAAESLLVNCATAPIDPNEVKCLPPGDGLIPYDWSGSA